MRAVLNSKCYLYGFFIPDIVLILTRCFLQTTPIDLPPIPIHVFANDSPLTGKEGTKLTSQVIRGRIYDASVTLHVLPGPTSESLELHSREVLRLGVLLKTRRFGHPKQ